MKLPQPPPWPVDLDQVRANGLQVARLLQNTDLEQLFRTLWPHGIPAVFGTHLSGDVGAMMQEIEYLRDVVACLVSLARRSVLLDPRVVLAVTGAGPDCVCPSADDFDPDCPLCAPGHITEQEMRQLFALARPAFSWEVGAWCNVYADDPDGDRLHDGLVANVLSAVVSGLRPGFAPGRAGTEGGLI